MAILYAVKNAQYYNLTQFSEDLAELKDYGNRIYVNLTNRCPCACTFCERPGKKMSSENSLWLEKEPDGAEVVKELKRFQWKLCDEIIFCGFGEPLERLDTILEVAGYIKSESPDMKIRINTNGLANLIHGENIVPRLSGLIDAVSISLNAPSAEQYLKVTRSKFGIGSFDALLQFAVECKTYIPQVVLSIVDVIGEEDIKACRDICERIGVNLRVRPYESGE